MRLGMVYSHICMVCRGVCMYLFMHVHTCSVYVWYVSECIYVLWICESSLCVYVFGVHCGEMRKEEWTDNTERRRRAERTRRWRRRGTALLGWITVPLRGATQAWCVRAMSFASLVTAQHML